MPPHASSSLQAVSGRATGVLFFAGFGALWLCAGLSSIHLLTWPRLALAVALPAVFLLAPAIWLLKTLPAAPADENRSAEEQRISRVFGRVNAAQWIGIVLVVVLLNVLHRPELIVPAVALIVGLHLFPLAGLFRYKPHYVTGTALVLWAVIAPLRFNTAATISAAAALGAAAILLSSAAFNLYSAIGTACKLSTSRA